MSPLIIDTDIILDILRGRDVHVRRNAQQYTAQYPLYPVTQITLTELAHGFYKREGGFETLNRVLQQCEVIALTDADAILAGEILARLENMGQTIGMADTLIAAIAINSGRTLVTANEKHFQRVVQIGYPLSIQNWRLPEQQEELPSG